jgi:hypothetical protein
VTPRQQENVHDALLAYWTSRDDATARQAASGVIDIGGRAGATAGGHLDRVAQLLARVCIDAGAPPAHVHYKAPTGDPTRRIGASTGFTLPGYYRPTKQWDLVVYHNHLPIVVVELKSQNGPSYGNNANNRAEEAIGNAVDLRHAREAGLVPGNPWTGYAFVLEDDSESRRERGANDRGMYLKDSIFNNWSYADRVRLLCQRLVKDGHYNAAWPVMTSRPTCPGTEAKPKKCPQFRNGIKNCVHKFGWLELDPMLLNYSRFVAEMEFQIKNYYKS